MKNLIASAAVVACLAGIGTSQVAAQAPAAAPSAGPHRVGLVDMGYVFKNYKKFEALREDLKKEIEATDQKARQMAEEIKILQGQLKDYKEGSPEFLQVEKTAAGKISSFEAFRKVAQRDFMRKESQIYKTIYLEATDVVQQAAGHFKYTLVLRFNRDGLEGVENPQEVLQHMNSQVVYFNTEDDITERVLTYLNSRYTSGGGGTAAAPAAAGAAPRTNTATATPPAGPARR